MQNKLKTSSKRPQRLVEAVDEGFHACAGGRSASHRHLHEADEAKRLDVVVP